MIQLNDKKNEVYGEPHRNLVNELFEHAKSSHENMATRDSIYFNIQTHLNRNDKYLIKNSIKNPWYN